MRIQTKIMILLIITLGVFILSVLTYQYISLNQARMYADFTNKSRQNIIDQTLRIKSEKYEQLTTHYSSSDRLVEFCQTIDIPWAKVNIEPMITAYKNNFITIYNREYQKIYATVDSSKRIVDFSIDDASLSKLFLEKKSVHYFTFINKQLYEIYASIVVPSYDYKNRVSRPEGYIFFGKQWDTAYVKEIQVATNSTVEIKQTKELKTRNLEDSIGANITNRRKILGITKNFIGEVEFQAPNPMYKDSLDFLNISIGATILSLIGFTVFFIFINKLVSKPLERISTTLDKNKTVYVEVLRKRNDEFGRLANMLIRFFEQKDELSAINNKLVQQKAEISSQNEKLIIQKNEMQRQRDQIEKKNKQITSSIEYALRIQTAVLPSNDFLRQAFPDHFIFFKPRDIVSGDFYWVTIVKRYLFAAVADCTGHGVPGAFMSMLGVSFLNEIVRQREFTQANLILNELRNQVKVSLQQTGKGSEPKDGMDICMIIIDLETLEMQYAGANLPLIIIRAPKTNTENYELIELAADRMPIGISMYPEESFKNHEFQLKRGDLFYMFSDGYQDQLGGPASSKFLRYQLKELFLKYCDRPMLEQRRNVESALLEWKGERRQVDDILVMGIKVSI